MTIDYEGGRCGGRSEKKEKKKESNWNRIGFV